MISKYLISLFVMLLLAAAGLAQTNYSESAEYRPRPNPTPVPTEEPKKKKSDKKDSRTTAPAVTMQAPEAVLAPVPSDASRLTAAGDITVTIPISVLDRSGSAVGGVKKEEISVFVDGMEVPVAGFEQDKEPVTMVIVLDSSPSAALGFETMQDQASRLVRALPSNMKVMVLDVNEQLYLRSQPTLRRADTLEALSNVKFGEGTSIYAAIQFMYEKLFSQIPGRKVVVLMTDGVDTTSRTSDFAKSLTEVEKQAVTIYPVYYDTLKMATGRGRLPDRQLAQILRTIDPKGTLTRSRESEHKIGLLYLNDLAAASGGRIISSEKLADETKSLLGELAGRYYVTITVPRKNAGSRPMRVRVNRPGLAVFARGSFVEK